MCDADVVMCRVCLQGVGSSWGGNPELLSPAPRFLDIEEFVSEAAACGATVILATHDTLTATGELQVTCISGWPQGWRAQTANVCRRGCNGLWPVLCMQQGGSLSWPVAWVYKTVLCVSHLSAATPGGRWCWVHRCDS
jgi:hypothetical protein